MRGGWIEGELAHSHTRRAAEQRDRLATRIGREQADVWRVRGGGGEGARSEERRGGIRRRKGKGGDYSYEVR